MFALVASEMAGLFHWLTPTCRPHVDHFTPSGILEEDKRQGFEAQMTSEDAFWLSLNSYLTLSSTTLEPTKCCKC